MVAARGTDGDCYILADLSCREAPAVWGRRAVTAFHEFRADCVVAEGNFGGEMVRATIQAADPNVPVRLVTASRGKAVRAEPISVRYAQRQVHHAGRFAKLEDQLCAFTSAGYGASGSPDHADAAIWALTYLFELGDGLGIIEFYRREWLRTLGRRRCHAGSARSRTRRRRDDRHRSAHARRALRLSA
ncbi:MAG: hypothetical protein ACLP8A_17055 [Methylovirgula sp.]